MNDQQNMKRSLKPRHIMMMTLGGTIGAGIFKGSSSAIEQAGPAVILSYLIGGFLLLIVMRGLAELAAANKNAHTLRDLLEPVLGSFVGTCIGWIYWVDWVLVMAAEMAAASTFLQYWFPTIPLWVLALLGSITMTLLNLFSVRIYGEAEYVLAGIKIVTLILFVVLGSAILGAHYTHHQIVQNLTAHGGFFPYGVSGILSAMLVVMFSFGGIEMIGMTMAETEKPDVTIPKAVRGVMVRVLLFYILPILVILSLVPWNTLEQAGSPFVTVFQQVGIPYVGSIMNFILLTAVLSATNSGMYAASRALYHQALLGNAPRFFAKLSKQKVPVRALLFSTLFLYVGVIIAFFAKGNTFQYLMVFPGYTVMIVWIAFITARIKQYGPTFSTVFAWLSLVIIFAGVIYTTPLLGTLISLAVVGVIAVSSVIQKRIRSAAALNL
jgi:AAT family amino acid transporter